MAIYFNVRFRGTSLRIEVLEARFDARVGDALVNWLSMTPDIGFDRVILDLDAVEFMDSSGLGAIVSFWRRFRDSKEICIAGVKPAVRDLLCITRMDYVLPISVSTQASYTGVQRQT